jgi:hypothetical protein
MIEIIDTGKRCSSCAFWMSTNGEPGPCAILVEDDRSPFITPASGCCSAHRTDTASSAAIRRYVEGAMSKSADLIESQAAEIALLRKIEEAAGALITDPSSGAEADLIAKLLAEATPKTCSNCRHFSEEYTEGDDSVAEVGNCGNPDSECEDIWVKPNFVCGQHSNTCPDCGQELGGVAAGDTVLGKCLACASKPPHA